MTPDQRRDKLAAAHLVTDALIALTTPGNRPEENSEALHAALSSVVSSGAVKIVADDRAPDGFHVDIGPLLHGSLEVSMWLLRELVRVTGTDPLDVLVALRDQLSDWDESKRQP